ncbi:uncharacterized protein LAJ45_02509 [Morchella importuna]|uniref:uncharacterized protein n=1 Tax=Morchella importuna TaxID=1174673 RepID=UPI001E8E82BA|nr:uncharacterized protein LAJ45_02509 [Morchella importuna]KAH8153696.1 hypothetical protein LAJ45_02509 [Morchella importuna]
MSSNTGHNPAAYDPAVIYWDWEGTKAIARPPPGLEHPSKVSKYPPGLGPTEQSPWDKPYFQRPGSRSRAGTLRRADVLIGDPKVQPDINLEKFTISVEARRDSEDKPIPSKNMPDFPETLYSESKRKVFEKMGHGFIESLQKLDKSNGTGIITDFSPILEDHWNQLAEFYSTIVSAARMLKSEAANSTHLPVFNDSPPILQPSPDRKSSPQEERATKEAFKSYSTLIEESKKKMPSTSSTPGKRTTHGPTNEDAGGLGQEDPRILGLVDDTNLDFSMAEQMPDAKLDKIRPVASEISTFESKLSEAIKSVRVNLKPFDATWNESQAEGYGHVEVVPRKTEGATLHADTQIELEMQEMIQRDNDDKSNHFNQAETSVDTGVKKSTECMQAEDTCTGSANDITLKTTGVEADLNESHSKGKEFIFKPFESEKYYSVVKDESVKESYLSGETDRAELSHTHKKTLNPTINRNTSFYCNYNNVSSAADSLFNLDCGSTPEEITPGEASHLAAITADSTNISIIDKDEKTLGLLEADSNDSFSLSSESSLFVGSTRDELEKLQIEVTNQLEKAKADGGSFTTKWMNQFGIKMEKRSEVGIKPDFEAGVDQAGEDKHSASVYYDVEVSSDNEDEITDDMEEVLAPMIESITEGSEIDESAKEYNYDFEDQTSIRTNDNRADIKANNNGSGDGKKPGEGGDDLRPLEQIVAESETEPGTGREEGDDEAGDLADGKNFELASNKRQTGGKPDGAVIHIKDTENDEDGDKMGRMDSEELGTSKL